LASDSQLSEVLSEFARTMVTDFPIQGILDHLVKRIVDIMPITAAGVTLISPGVEPRYIAASNGAALQFEKLQTELDEGPCLAAYQSGEAISVPDLRAEDRFPTFVSRASEVGLGAVFTFPLRHGERRIGALDLYRDTPGELSAESMAAAQTLADVTTAYLLNAEGRADLKEASHRSHELSLHDALTGLPNRALLMERLGHALRRGQRSGLLSAVFFIDLDRFKAVNDTFGHRVGDELLVAVAERLSEVLRPGDTLARVSGDEFVVICEDLISQAQADVIVNRLDAALDRPFPMSSAELSISASVGVSFAGQGLEDPEDVLHAADMAMYRAKRGGGSRHEVVDLRDEHFASYQAALEQDMHGLLERGELYIDYQPIVAIGDGHITGVEALLRWAHPSRGLVTPGVLIPLAEKGGLIPSIGWWVLKEASAQQARWQHELQVDDVAVSVNVSAHQLMSPGFVDIVASVVNASQSPPDQLILEITESVFVSDTDRALIVLYDLKALGVKLALDDFGTGYSALSYLLQFPVDIVKIDQVFVAGLGRDDTSQAIVSAIIQLAHDLGLTVVAEGVESVEQRRELARLGCDSCQGFYFAHPMAAAKIDLLIRHRFNGAHQCLPALAASGREPGS
jgi:diguanylate cyclase (GGDEF)-like protein